jgi:hypothetical protein
MTTGRINQVTTFRPAFAAIVYSRVISTRFRDVEFVIPLWYFRLDPSQLKTGFPPGKSNTPLLNPQMASPRFPFSHVSSEIPLSYEKNKGHPPSMETTNDR